MGRIGDHHRGQALREQDLDEEPRHGHGADHDDGLAWRGAGPRVERVGQHHRSRDRGGGRERELESFAERDHPAGRRDRRPIGHRGATARQRTHRGAAPPADLALPTRIDGADEDALAQEDLGALTGTDHAPDAGRELGDRLQLDRDVVVAELGHQSSLRLLERTFPEGEATSVPPSSSVFSDGRPSGGGVLIDVDSSTASGASAPNAIAKSSPSGS